MRGVNRLGWGEKDTNTPVTPGELNDVYKYGQFWVPAGAWTPAPTDPCIIEEYESTGTGDKPCYTVAKFPPSVDTLGHFSWGFKADFVNVPNAVMEMKMFGVWFAKTTAAAPNNGTRIEYGALNLNLGSSVNINGVAGPYLVQTVPATAFLLQSGIPANAEAAGAITIGGDALASANFNMINMYIERTGSNAADTFLDDIYYVGVSVQWRTNFNNISVWATS